MLIPALAEDPEDPTPVRVVIDQEGATYPERMVCLMDHCDSCVIGTWSNLSTGPEGLDADLDLMELTDSEEDRGLFYEVMQARARLRNQVPMQVSVGAAPHAQGRYELIPAGESVVVNGQTYTGDADLPLYVLRGADFFEASIVTFGADSRTGRLAASRQSSRQTVNQPSPTGVESMDKAAFQRLLAAHPKHKALIADLYADGKAESDVLEAIAAARDRAKDAEIAKLKAANAKLAKALRAKAEGMDDDEDAEGEDDESDDETEAEDDESDDEDAEAEGEEQPDELTAMGGNSGRARASRRGSKPTGSRRGVRFAAGGGSGKPGPKTLAEAKQLIRAELGQSASSMSVMAAVYRRYPKLIPDHVKTC